MRYKIASLAAAAIAFGGVQAASAADMAVKAPPMAAPIVTYNWTGFYVGLTRAPPGQPIRRLHSQ